jgi:glyceraldehyde-3-phosphate dehydrogenase/erythrose-4-phosphate dehydrogenase
MTILKTKDNKVDITGDLLKEGEVYDRFSDKVQGKISDIIFGSDKIHVLVNDDTIQFSLNA